MCRDLTHLVSTQTCLDSYSEKPPGFRQKSLQTAFPFPNVFKVFLFFRIESLYVVLTPGTRYIEQSGLELTVTCLPLLSRAGIKSVCHLPGLLHCLRCRVLVHCLLAHLPREAIPSLPPTRTHRLCDNVSKHLPQTLLTMGVHDLHRPGSCMGLMVNGHSEPE